MKIQVIEMLVTFLDNLNLQMYFLSSFMQMLPGL